MLGFGKQLSENFVSGANLHSLSCFGCGSENPKGLGADFSFDVCLGEVSFRYCPSPFQCSAKGILHGGVLASLLDEAQGMLCAHLGFLVMTDELSLKYHKVAYVENTFNIRAWVVQSPKKRIYTRASLKNENQELLVNSKASWYILPERIWDRVTRLGLERREELHSILQENRKRAHSIRRQIRSKKNKTL